METSAKYVMHLTSFLSSDSLQRHYLAFGSYAQSYIYRFFIKKCMKLHAHIHFLKISFKEIILPPITSNSILCSKISGVQLRVLYLVCFIVLIGSLIIITRWYIEHVFLIAVSLFVFFLTQGDFEIPKCTTKENNFISLPNHTYFFSFSQKWFP